MKKIYAFILVVLALSGCTDKNMFLLQCNTKGFFDYRDLTFRECKCVVEKLESTLSVDEFSDMSKKFQESSNTNPVLEPKANVMLHEAGRQCINIFKQ